MHRTTPTQRSEFDFDVIGTPPPSRPPRTPPATPPAPAVPAAPTGGGPAAALAQATAPAGAERR